MVGPWFDTYGMADSRTRRLANGGKALVGREKGELETERAQVRDEGGVDVRRIDAGDELGRHVQTAGMTREQHCGAKN
jgi:hypothetical protein